MMSTSLVILSSQSALANAVDVIANNIANSSTIGFKREGEVFNTYLNRLNGAQVANGTATSFVGSGTTYRDASPGTISNTGNALDLAIQGPGYFQVQTPQGIQYTRDGAFHTNNAGQIVTSTGQPVLSDSGQPILLPDDASDITISANGFITAQSGTGPTRTQLGKIGVVSFPDEQQVKAAGGNMYTTAQSPSPITGDVLVEGAVEESNVKPVLEITHLIELQRAYEQASNLIGNENSRLSDAMDKLSQ